ncbi:hypothetical protein IX339_000386 [Porphyromonas levii]|nr:hypothetical protein [Porphyromonas levii]MBR8727471.1 hypothetical protein [Porphyromonas levii]MBR8730950.1 hypothetical protein [Porphyromonas levii]MBR8735809.1 hypothetical protein [Porphyromonas levii]MBR8777881.1 hypothetical protein [Porphyromonas levii]
MFGEYRELENVARSAHSRRFACKSAETLHGGEIQGTEIEADGSVLTYVTEAECRK